MMLQNMTDPRFPSLENDQQTEHILIADDDPLILASLKAILERDGYQIVTAKNGTEALELLAKYPIAVIICDQGMPDMAGTEVLQKAQLLSPDTIRVILTGNHDIEAVIAAINVGKVFQFIVKPWENNILSQVVRSSLERYKLVKENQSLQQLILAQHKALVKTYDILKGELALGGRIHETLLMGAPPQNIPGCSISAATSPSKDIDGDFYDFYQPIPEILDFVLGDVMGKGLPAALVGTSVKTHLVRFSMPFFHSKRYDKYHFWQDDLLSPIEILTQLHNELSSRLLYLEFFVSLFYGRFNLNQRTFTYIDCGSQKPLHYKAATKEITELKGNCLPLGISQDPEYEELTCNFNKGDLFIFYSDGVSEARSPENELFGTHRIEEVVKKNADTSAEQILKAIHQDVIQFIQRDFFEDDLTVIVVKFDEILAGAFSKARKATFSSHLSQLTPVREFVGRLCQHAPGNTDFLKDMMQLAVTEIFTNVVQHAYQENENGKVIVIGELTDEGLAIEIAEQGKPFNPATVPHPSLTTDDEGGFGWYIIKSIVDEISYHPKVSKEGWNHLRIFKRFLFTEDSMQLTHKQEGDTLVITPHCNSLDAREAKEFKQNIIDTINLESANKIVLDLSNIQYIDSSGLGSLLSILKYLHTKQGELKLASLNKPVRTIFELVAMHKIFEIYNSSEDAINSYH